MERIYWDNAATTRMDEGALQSALPYFSAVYGNADSLHSFGRQAKNAVDEARDKIAASLGVRSNEVYFTSGGTESDNWALIGAARAQRALGKNRVLISAIEHHAVLSAADELAKEGFTVEKIPVDDGGMVELNALKAQMGADVGVVAVMAVNNETGVVQPIRECAEIVKAQGGLFFCDAVQAVGLSIDVKAWGVDLLSLSSHKFYGGRGAGVLYVRNGVKIEKFMVGGEQERGLRGGTTNVPAIVAMASAYEKLQRERGVLEEHTARLTAAFIRGVKEYFPTVQFNGDRQNCVPSIVNFRIPGVDGGALMRGMDLKGVAIATGAACASADPRPSHVLLAMGLTEKEAKECVRVSFGKYNTEEEIGRGLSLMQAVVREILEHS